MAYEVGHKLNNGVLQAQQQPQSPKELRVASLLQNIGQSQSLRDLREARKKRTQRIRKKVDLFFRLGVVVFTAVVLSHRPLGMPCEGVGVGCGLEISLKNFKLTLIMPKCKFLKCGLSHHILL